MIGENLACFWEVAAPARQDNDLPPFYSISVPPDQRARDFSPPAFLSSFHAGIVGHDWYAWTWMLEKPLCIAEAASGIAVGHLRLRVARIMEGLGGASLFDAEATKAQRVWFEDLGLFGPHRILLVTTAYRAMRSVLAELQASCAIDPDALPHILRWVNVAPLGARSAAPVPRPAGMPCPDLTSRYQVEKDDAWLEAGAGDLALPRFDDEIVLAHAAHHECGNSRSYDRVEIFYGPGSGDSKHSLEPQILALPMAVLGDTFMPPYNGFAQGAVAWADTVAVTGHPDATLMFCPRVAAALGWRNDSADIFAYRDGDGDGEVTARTIRWRDGGLRSDNTDRRSERGKPSLSEAPSERLRTTSTMR